MRMTLRWFGKKYDSVTLEQIRQIPGVTGVITTLYYKQAGEVWKLDEILELKKEVEEAGLKIEGIESVNIHDTIKTGSPEREKYISNYIETLENLAKADIKLVCYNFMPVFDWTRSNLAKKRPDGSTVLSYDQELIDKINPETIFDDINSNSNGFVMPGWEPERLSKIKELFEMYKNITSEKLLENLLYFLNKIKDTCKKNGIKMAIHPDDPAWPVFGLPRIINSKENIKKLLDGINEDFNGLTLCTGSLGSNPNNDICDIIKTFGNRIYFAHIRNLKHHSKGKFEEAAHLSSDGSFDMYKIMKTLYETGFKGPIRPDHGRAIWGEVAMPGYGLYDRALGATYLNGLIEAIEKGEKIMELNLKNLENREFWENKGYKLPKFDINKVHKQTKNSPQWIHFGTGNIFRAFPASICQNLLNEGIITEGIITVEGYDYEIIEKCMNKYDNLIINVTLKSDGTVNKEIIASITESLCMDNKNERDMDRLREIFRNKNLKITSFTITEKGYNLRDKNGNFTEAIEKDFKNPPSVAESYIGKVAALCFERFKNNKLPLTMLSMDNCSHNGTLLEKAILEFAENWAKNGFVEESFKKYIMTEISFPWSMIDKITPRPSDKVFEMLKNDNIENITPFVTNKNTYTAPFVNGEETEYLIIEDNFKNGKIPLNKSNKKGVIFTDKETVDKTEKMKVCTCLNPLHTTLAIFGCLLSYTKISEEMNNPALVKLITEMSEKESLPVVINPEIINPKEFLDEVIKVRFPNNFMPDTPQRIACDTSQKLSVRFGETIKAYIKSDKLNLENLKYIPLVIAGWIRYLMGINDNGEKFELSPDPYIENLKPLINKINFGNNNNSDEIVGKIISDKAIFGLNLKETPLYNKILNYFKELNSGKNAVINTLKNI